MILKDYGQKKNKKRNLNAIGPSVGTLKQQMPQKLFHSLLDLSPEIRLLAFKSISPILTGVAYMFYKRGTLDHHPHCFVSCHTHLFPPIFVHLYFCCWQEVAYQKEFGCIRLYLFQKTASMRAVLLMMS